MNTKPGVEILSNAQKQQMLEQMQKEKELDQRIRGMNKERHKKPQRSVSSKARMSYSGNPNGGSDSEQDTNMNKRTVHSDGESIPDRGSKKSKPERGGGANTHKVPSNKGTNDYQYKSHYETGYIGDKEPKDTNEKGQGKNKGGKSATRRKGVKQFFPAPDYDDPLVMMQNQMEICRMKGERRITIEVSKVWFTQMRDKLIQTKGSMENNRVKEECTKKTFLIYIQEWLATAGVKRTAQTSNEETEEQKDRKSYLQKIKEMMYDLKSCEMYPMISGFQENRSWYDDKMVFAIRGNPGCEIWFRRLADLSKTGRIWELNEEGGTYESYAQ